MNKKCVNFEEYVVKSIDEIEQIEQDYLEDIYYTTIDFLNKINKATNNGIYFKIRDNRFDKIGADYNDKGYHQIYETEKERKERNNKTKEYVKNLNKKNREMLEVDRKLAVKYYDHELSKVIYMKDIQRRFQNHEVLPTIPRYYGSRWLPINIISEKINYSIIDDPFAYSIEIDNIFKQPLYSDISLYLDEESVEIDFLQRMGYHISFSPLKKKIIISWNEEE